MRALITTIRVTPHGAHEKVAIWVRHGLAGTLTVGEGDGAALAALLMGERTVVEHHDGTTVHTPGEVVGP